MTVLGAEQGEEGNYAQSSSVRAYEFRRLVGVSMGVSGLEITRPGRKHSVLHGRLGFCNEVSPRC